MQKSDKNIETDAYTELYCIFGKPVRHSLSPAMQNAAFIESGVNAKYLAFEVDDMKAAINAMKILNIRGASVTIPNKEAAFKYADHLDPLAEEMGSVNTLKNIDGKIYGYNTDGAGAVRAIRENGFEIKDKDILVIGNGGSARGIAYALLNEKARVVIAGRNSEKIMSLVKNIRKRHKFIDFILIEDINKNFMEDMGVIINTTPIGMSPDIDNIPIDESLITKRHIVFDIVYSPDMTKLLQISKDKGCKIIHGIEMLVNQGALQFEIWTGLKPPLSVMEKAVRKKILCNSIKS
jgi:shikimate dehydrogenase